MDRKNSFRSCLLLIHTIDQKELFCSIITFALSVSSQQLPSTDVFLFTQFFYVSFTVKLPCKQQHLLIQYCNVLMTMSGTHTEALLNKLTKPELVQLLLKTEATLGSQISDQSKEIKDTLTHLKMLEADIAVVKTVNDRLVKRIVKTERQCWENAQYSRRDTLEIVGVPDSIDNGVLEEAVRGIFKKIGVEVNKRDVQACHRLKQKE